MFQPSRLQFVIISLLPFVPAQHLWALRGSTTRLAVTSAGSPVTTVSSGGVVTLTATVDSNGSGVTPGLVNFCDAEARYCSDIHLLGTAQLTAAGTAVFRFRPAPGAHKYKAVFAGTTIVAGSVSPVSALAVTGGAPSVLSIVQSGGAYSKYGLTAIAGGNGNAAIRGNVSFVDTSRGNAVLAAAPLGASAKGVGFINTANPSVGSDPTADPAGVAVADFNGDGIPDLATANGDGTVTILLGVADGTFMPPAVLQYAANTIATADFNSDGIPDLVLGNTSDYDTTLTLSVLLGKGDGTFKTAVTETISIGTDASTAIGDFNGDGIPDLALVGYGNANVEVLLGSGDGTFKPAVSSSGPYYASSIATADFNGDGIADLVVANVYDRPTILLGKGDGTFITGPTLPALIQYLGADVVVADFNGDGIPDLAASDTVNLDNVLMVWLGKGDGSFNLEGLPLQLNGFPIALASGDFNGDGIPDLAVGVSGGPGPIDLLLGNGDGTFNQGLPEAQGAAVAAFAAADLNGDGIPDLAATGAANTVTLLLTVNQTASAARPDITVGPAGTVHQVVASYAGGSGYAPGFTEPVTLIAKATPAVTMSMLVDPVVYGTVRHITVTVTGSVSTPTGEVELVLGSYKTISATLNNAGIATFYLNRVPPGQYATRAMFQGNAYYNPAWAPTHLDVVVVKAPQSITFPPIGPVTYGATPISLPPYSSANQPLTYKTTGPASVSGTTLSFLGAGAVATTAYQDGNADYEPAKPVEQTVVVQRADLNVIAQDATRAYGAANPAFTYRISGYVNGDKPSVVKGEAVLSTTATPSSPPGKYPIIVSAGNLKAQNYRFILTNGVLTITP